MLGRTHTVKKTDIQEGRIYNYVKERIMSRSIFPGSRIVEDDLAKDFGVSRAAIRHVMTRLENDGFVEIVPNKGAMVSKPTSEEILKVYHTRLYLELGACALAVHNITDEAIMRMEENYAAQVKLKDSFSIADYVELNRDFHWEIVRASNNEFYEKYLNEIYNVMHIYMIFYDYAMDNSRSLQTHRLLLNALKERNLSKAEEALRLDNANSIDGLKIGRVCGV